MKHIKALSSAVCRLTVTFQTNPHGAMVLVILASWAVTGLWILKH